MAKTFTITTTATDSIKSNDKGHAEAVFTVTNTGSRPVRCMAKAKALDSTKQEWLQITGDSERDFGPGSTQQIVITFDAPVVTPAPAAPPTTGATAPGTPPATPPATADKYSFRLDVSSIMNPDEDFTEGPVVKVEMPSAPPVKVSKPFPKWIIPVIVVVVLLIAGVLAWLLWPKDKYQLPDVANASSNDAKQRLESECKAGTGCVSVEVTPIADNTVAKDLAIRTEPAAGTAVAPGSNVILFVSTGPEVQPKETFKLPPLANLVEERVKQVLDGQCKTPPCVQIDVNRVGDSRIPAGTVIRSEPPEGSDIEVGSHLALFVSRGPDRVTILNVGNQLEDRAREMLEKSCDPVPCVDVEINRVADNRFASGRAIRTSPEAGTQVQTGSRVQVFVSTGPIPTATPNQAALEALCFNAVQGKIAWNYQNNKSWSPNNVQDLCRGSTNPSQPPQCFQRVMHGGINWGGGTQWQWENARDLCAGTNDAARSISCFQSNLRGAAWQNAIQACKSR